MGRSLAPGSRLAHYRILSPLGAGGMGEVYLAQDLTLDRSVALKILPPAVVRNEERVLRFIQEAKAASALNHPHIVTIYEIGQALVEPADGDAADAAAAAAPIHYIAMELVTGDTLGHVIHRDKLDLRPLLGYLAQVAEGLAKAHAAGIVHRDLKPDNIMVSKDGYAKVLDFGLAKLTERQDMSAEETGLPTQTPAKTTEGVVMGTAGYMSPEQVQGKGVDHRSDIFSFGCILYEATTRQRPFTADSSIEVMHKIITEKPAPVEELNPEAPGELRRLIRRCLAKAPEQRLQSMKDLALDLREIVDEFENLSLTSVSRTSGAAPVVVTSRFGPRVRVLLVAATLIGIGGLAFGIYGWTHRRGAANVRSAPFQSMVMTRLTTSGNVFGAALSTDGRYLAQVLRDQGRWSLWVKQVSTGSQVQIVTPQDLRIGRLSFSPDGEYVFYLAADPEAPLYSALFQVPSLGGTPRKLLFDIDTAVTFSPDGKQVAFVRGYPHIGQSALMVSNADGSAERKLAVLQQPRRFDTISPSWSPDGTRIAASVNEEAYTTVVTVAVADGKQTPLGGPFWLGLDGLAWLPDGSGLVITATRRDGILEPQVWQLTFPAGEVQRITNDMNRYSGVNITADARRIATVQTGQVANLWVAPAAAPSDAKQITFGSSEDAITAFTLTPDGNILFTQAQERSLHIYAMALDGSGRRQLTSGPTLNANPCRVRDNDLLVFTSLRDDSVPHLWKMHMDGSGLVQLTKGAGEFAVSVDPRGRWALYTRTDSAQSLWKIALDGGTPEKLVGPVQDVIGLSPDGERLAYTCFRQEGERIYADIAVMSVSGGAPLRTLPMPEGGYFFVWSPHGDALDYIRESGGVANIWRLPLGGGAPTQLTHFENLLISTFAWSADGQQLVLSRGETRNDVVLISDFR